MKLRISFLAAIAALATGSSVLAADITLLNVCSDPRPAIDHAFDAAFTKPWKGKSREKVEIKQLQPLGTERETPRRSAREH